MFDLTGKTALVTGAATGLGQAIAVALTTAGARVALSNRRDLALDETAELCAAQGAAPLSLTIDVRDLAQITEGVAAVEAELGHVDILVNNAGINRPAPGLEVDVENWDDHFNTNVRGGFFCAQAVAPKMIERGFGRVVFISSQSGLIGIPGQPVYCASKGAIINLVRTLGVEWAKHGVTVNSVAPTFVETNLTRARLAQPEFRAFVLGKIPSGKLATPEDIAHAVVYLASDEAGMVNCATLPVDGGWTAW
ncbi:MAG: 2-deoxy-D-gluconate 3-dehydrogenase [Acidobacteria bacterium]|jgi:NAD(P)-dependent dehydrogenase (short-subunit alcohol dehydrogenase family)|nr:2-deoxy-D-gluconate 3-dehydrogenase [Acidobacteriota bacterium]MDP7479877.1 SDR family oxidoreductase [Vicinamibacterales bacterium]HJN43057.1 SDR family oxidoreductase [Vicinamibacterales bacterium]